jgi:nucleoside-diphosphate-sugar epimerase
LSEEQTPQVTVFSGSVRRREENGLEIANAYDFRQDIAYDTTRIRAELGYNESVSYEECLKRTLRATLPS